MLKNWKNNRFALAYKIRTLRIHRCATGDTSRMISLSHGYVISTPHAFLAITFEICSNFNINALQKNVFIAVL